MILMYQSIFIPDAKVLIYENRQIQLCEDAHIDDNRLINAEPIEWAQLLGK